MATRRRGPTLIVPSTVNVKDWEAKAPLDDLELRSIGLVKTASETLPLPLKVGHIHPDHIAFHQSFSSTMMTKTFPHVRRHLRRNF